MNNTSVIVFASGDIGLHFVNYIIESHLSTLSCVVLLDKSGPIYELVKSTNILNHIYTHDQAFLDFIKSKSLHPMFGFLVWWPKLVSDKIIDLFDGRLVNTHPSYLPYNRGKNYNFWALVEQCPFGVTLHLVDKGIDTGQILFQEKIEYNWLDTGESLFFKAKVAMKSLLENSFESIINHDYTPFDQSADIGSMHYASELDDASYIQLDEPTTARKLLNLLRARTFDGYPSCTFSDFDGIVYNVSVSIKLK